MGGEPYSYFVPYTQDANEALQLLRAKVFAGGKYNGAKKKPATPEQALEWAAEDGTRSILDILEIDSEPDYCKARPLTDAELKTLYGTTKPTHKDIDDSRGACFDEVERGHAILVTVYKDDQPSEYFFAGMSFD